MKLTRHSRNIKNPTYILNILQCISYPGLRWQIQVNMCPTYTFLNTRTLKLQPQKHFTLYNVLPSLWAQLTHLCFIVINRVILNNRTEHALNTSNLFTVTTQARCFPSAQHLSTPTRSLPPSPLQKRREFEIPCATALSRQLRQAYVLVRQTDSSSKISSKSSKFFHWTCDKSISNERN